MVANANSLPSFPPLVVFGLTGLKSEGEVGREVDFEMPSRDPSSGTGTVRELRAPSNTFSSLFSWAVW